MLAVVFLGLTAGLRDADLRCSRSSPLASRTSDLRCARSSSPASCQASGPLTCGARGRRPSPRARQDISPLIRYIKVLAVVFLGFVAGLPLSLLSDAHPVVADYGYPFGFSRTVLSFSLIGGRLWVWNTLRPDTLSIFVCVLFVLCPF